MCMSNTTNYQMDNDADCSCRSPEGCSSRRTGDVKNTDREKRKKVVVWWDNRPCC